MTVRSIPTVAKLSDALVNSPFPTAKMTVHEHWDGHRFAVIEFTWSGIAIREMIDYLAECGIASSFGVGFNVHARVI